jgi:outer membrane protein assembly factor BamA
MSRLFLICVLLLPISSFGYLRAFVEQQPEEIADTTARARVGVLPLPIFFYTPETGIAGGGAILLLHRPVASDKALRPSSYALDVIYTQKKQIIAEGSADMYFDRGAYRLVGFAHFSRYPQKFYGIGNQTPDSFEEDYTSRTFRASLDALGKINGPISAGPSLFYEDRSLSDLTADGTLQSGTITGSQGGKTLGIGGVVQWDTRDNIFGPSAGQYYIASLRTSLPGSDFKFSNLTLDVRHYLDISGMSTFAMQALAVFTSGNPPFYLLPGLGGPNIMRGYYEGRYRDKKLLVIQTEYRIPIVWRFGGALFAGAGDVAPTLGKFTLHTIKPSYGFGLRYLFDPVEKMCIRIDFGFGKGTSGMYITANEAI